MLLYLSISILTKLLTPQRQDSCLFHVVELLTQLEVKKHCQLISCIAAQLIGVTLVVYPLTPHQIGG